MSFVSLLPSISEPERSPYPLGMCKGKQGKLELLSVLGQEDSLVEVLQGWMRCLVKEQWMPLDNPFVG